MNKNFMIKLFFELNFEYIDFMEINNKLRSSFQTYNIRNDKFYHDFEF